MPKRLLALLFAALLLGLGACSDDSSDGDVTAGDQATESAESTPGEEPSEPAEGACSYESDGMDPAKPAEAPPAEPTETGKVNVTIETSAGDVKAVLDAGKTPCTVNSFLSLAEQDYFDDTQCHRLTTQGIFVLQCGDPSATGMGGPGYQFADELDGSETYGAGTLAMANAGPDTNGSQFFMVYKDSQLPPSYAVFGQVDTASIKLLQSIAAKGTQTGQPDGPPKDEVTIDEVD